MRLHNREVYVRLKSVKAPLQVRNLHISVQQGEHAEGMHFCSDEHATREESATLWPLRGRTARSRGTIALDEFPWRRAD